MRQLCYGVRYKYIYAGIARAAGKLFDITFSTKL